jgi:hypothetical protein
VVDAATNETIAGAEEIAEAETDVETIDAAVAIAHIIAETKPQDQS